MTRPGPRGRLRQRTRARTPALAGPALAQEEPGGEGRVRRHRVPSDQISIQLFTLRDQLAIDLEGTLQALHQIGYTRVENAGFVGRTVQEFKAALLHLARRCHRRIAKWSRFPSGRLSEVLKAINPGHRRWRSGPLVEDAGVSDR